LASSEKLLPITLLPKKYQFLFPFEYFNQIQTNVFNIILKSKKSLVIATPTGSGKTVLAELAIIKVLEELSKSDNNLKMKKIIYLSPLKALSYEKQHDFKKFAKLGINIESITGDRSSNTNYAQIYSKLVNTNLIISTIEKFDSLTRQQRNYFLIKDLKLLIIDEIHLLGDSGRGPTLETVLTRIKLINPECRIIGLSATLPNVELIATWLQAEAIIYDERFRPSKLNKKIISYSGTGNDFRDKFRRLYKSWSIIKKFLPSQTLVFVNSRADTVLSAKKFVEYMMKGSPSPLIDFKVSVTNQKLLEVLKYGVAFHHAGLSFEDRMLVENLFKEKKISIIVATSTLAWGVNLPAKVVIIQDFEVHSEDFTNEIISTSDLLQMLGRAGRPGFDSVGYGYIIVEEGEVEERIKFNLENPLPIQSSFKEKLEDILVGEIYRKNFILLELEKFLKNTFYWIQNTNPIDREEFLVGLEQSLKKLEQWQIIILFDSEYRITPIGSLLAQYYIDIESGIALIFYCSKTQNGIRLLLDVIDRIEILKNFPVRSSEKKIIKTLAKEIITLKEDNFSILKVLIVIHHQANKKPIPVELIADSYVINHSFIRYWEFFKSIYRFMHGDSYFKEKKSLFEELQLI
jgi:replicative superfamily II helicase